MANTPNDICKEHEDFFHEEVPFSFIKNVFDVMEACSWHIYQVLTKRPERMLEYAQLSYGAGEVAEPCLGWSFRGEPGLGRPDGSDIMPSPSCYTVSLM